MRKAISVVLLVGAVLVFSGCSSSKWENGTFYGTGTGHGGPIKVEVVIEKGKIAKVEAVEHGETPGLGDAALTKISAEVIEAQKADVDSVTGATVTSEGFKAAISDALSQAEKK